MKFDRLRPDLVVRWMVETPKIGTKINESSLYLALNKEILEINRQKLIKQNPHSPRCRFNESVPVLVDTNGVVLAILHEKSLIKNS